MGVVGDRGGCVVVGHRGQVGGETGADRLVGGEGGGGGNHLVSHWGNVLLVGNEGGGGGDRNCRAAHCMLGNCGNRLVGCEGCTRGNNWGNCMVDSRGCHRLVSGEGEGGVGDRMVADGGCEGGDGGNQGGG